MTPKQLVAVARERVERDRTAKELRDALSRYCHAPWEFLKINYLENAKLHSLSCIDRFFRDAVADGSYGRYMNRAFEELKEAYLIDIRRR